MGSGVYGADSRYGSAGNRQTRRARLADVDSGYVAMTYDDFDPYGYLNYPPGTVDDRMYCCLECALRLEIQTEATPGSYGECCVCDRMTWLEPVIAQTSAAN